MKMSNSIKIILTILFAIPFLCCKKQDEFLDAKPNDALAIPSTLADLQLMLQGESLFVGNDPALGEIGSDDYYLTPSNYNNLYVTELNAYTWAKQIYTAGSDDENWTAPYNQVYITNIILEVLPTISVSPGEQAQADQIKGSALFLRSLSFYNLVQTFALPYDSATSGKDPGIPLRMTSNVTVRSVRATVQQCYDQIITDLKTALPLLPVTATYVTMPSRTAANAVLARIYMAVGNYAEAFKYADASLGMYNTLMDYNTIVPGPRSISTTFPAEDILHRRMPGYDTNISGDNIAIIDSILYRSYDDNDLRKSIFFSITDGFPYFRGSYDYKSYAFSGIATDEVYLMRAECNARLGNTAAAMKDLNDLLKTRWKTQTVNGVPQSTFVDYTASSSEDALRKILMERRKELIFRGLRWLDLRRLNKDPRFAVTLVRNIAGTQYTLPPNDSRYAWPIPDTEILASGMEQNPR